MHKILHSINTTKFFFRYKDHVNGSLKLNLVSLEISKCRKILHSDAFHVLRASSINSALCINIGSKWFVSPKFLENWHHVHMRVENDRLEFRLASPPCHNANWLFRRHRNFHFKFKAQLIGLFFQKRDAWL